MGVQLTKIVPAEEIQLKRLVGKKVAIDAYNAMHQFISIIRLRTGEPLRDSKGRVTSHLSGLFYRTAKLLEAGIKPCYVFDGEKPEFKTIEVEARIKARKEAYKKWKEAEQKGKLEEARIYAQAAGRLTPSLVKDAQKLLDLLGIPWIQAPEEGEAQCAQMCKSGMVDYSGSQDYDTLLFGSPSLVRNLSITGKRKLPRKQKWVEVKPELIKLSSTLEKLRLDRKGLIIVGILAGTDYDPGGIKGYGPKKSLKFVRKHRELKSILKKVKWEHKADPKQIFDYYLKRPSKEVENLSWKMPDLDGLLEFMHKKHDFSADRIRKTLDKLGKAQEKAKQRTLEKWAD